MATEKKEIDLTLYRAEVDGVRDEPPLKECRKMFHHYALEFFEAEIGRVLRTMKAGGHPDMAHMVPPTEHHKQMAQELRTWGERYDRYLRPEWWAGFDELTSELNDRIRRLQEEANDA